MRERARERREEPRESEREQGGGRGVVRGIERGGEGRQAGEQVAWRGGARARRPHSPPSVGTKTTEEGGGLGRLLAGPASWLGCTGRSPGKVLPFIYFCFLIFNTSATLLN